MHEIGVRPMTTEEERKAPAPLSAAPHSASAAELSNQPLGTRPRVPTGWDRAALKRAGGLAAPSAPRSATNCKAWCLDAVQLEGWFWRQGFDDISIARPSPSPCALLARSVSSPSNFLIQRRRASRRRR